MYRHLMHTYIDCLLLHAHAHPHIHACLYAQFTLDIYSVIATTIVKRANTN